MIQLKSTNSFEVGSDLSLRTSVGFVLYLSIHLIAMSETPEKRKQEEEPPEDNKKQYVHIIEIFILFLENLMTK